MKYRIKRFSNSQRNYGKTWEGIKGAVKGAGTGAKWGAILAPGNLTALALGHPKVALGITGAGAAIGAGMMAKEGWENGRNQWKYDHDPEYKKKKDAEDLKKYKESIKSSLDQDKIMAEDFSYRDWENLSKELKNSGKIIPKEVLDYIKFYETTWKKKIDKWYAEMPETGDFWYLLEFKEIFPMPYVTEYVKEWLEYDKGDICLFTVNDAGDDGWVFYNFEQNSYGWDGVGPYEKSFKKFMMDNINHSLKDKEITPAQQRLVNEFKLHIR